MHKKLKFAYILMCVAISGLFIFGKEAATVHLPLSKIINDCIDLYYKPSYNLITSFPINGIFFNFYVYSILTLGCMLSALGCRIFFKERGVKNIFQVCMLVVFIGLFSLTGMQSLSQIKYYMVTYIKLLGLNTEQIYSKNFSHPYKFSQFCKNIISGSHRAVLLTDLDLTQSRMVYVLAYLLYPSLQFLNEKEDGSEIFLVVYMKNDARESVPDHFQIIREFDPYSLLAKRK